MKFLCVCVSCKLNLFVSWFVPNVSHQPLCCVLLVLVSREERDTASLAVCSHISQRPCSVLTVRNDAAGERP